MSGPGITILGLAMIVSDSDMIMSDPDMTTSDPVLRNASVSELPFHASPTMRSGAVNQVAQWRVGVP